MTSDNRLLGIAKKTIFNMVDVRHLHWSCGRRLIHNMCQISSKSDDFLQKYGALNARNIITAQWNSTFPNKKLSYR